MSSTEKRLSPNDFIVAFPSEAPQCQSPEDVLTAKLVMDVDLRTGGLNHVLDDIRRENSDIEFFALTFSERLASTIGVSEEQRVQIFSELIQETASMWRRLFEQRNRDNQRLAAFLSTVIQISTMGVPETWLPSNLVPGPRIRP